MTRPDETPLDSAAASGWRSGAGLSGLQRMQAAASLNLDAADQPAPDEQADDDTAGPTALAPIFTKRIVPQSESGVLVAQCPVAPPGDGDRLGQAGLAEGGGVGAPGQ